MGARGQENISIKFDIDVSSGLSALQSLQSQAEKDEKTFKELTKTIDSIGKKNTGLDNMSAALLGMANDADKAVDQLKGLNGALSGGTNKFLVDEVEQLEALREAMRKYRQESEKGNKVAAMNYAEQATAWANAWAANTGRDPGNLLRSRNLAEVLKNQDGTSNMPLFKMIYEDTTTRMEEYAAKNNVKWKNSFESMNKMYSLARDAIQNGMDISALLGTENDAFDKEINKMLKKKKIDRQKYWEDAKKSSYKTSQPQQDNRKLYEPDEQQFAGRADAKYRRSLVSKDKHVINANSRQEALALNEKDYLQTRKQYQGKVKPLDQLEKDIISTLTQYKNASEDDLYTPQYKSKALQLVQDLQQLRARETHEEKISGIKQRTKISQKMQNEIRGIYQDDILFSYEDQDNQREKKKLPKNTHRYVGDMRMQWDKYFSDLEQEQKRTAQEWDKAEKDRRKQNEAAWMREHSQTREKQTEQTQDVQRSVNANKKSLSQYSDQLKNTQKLVRELSKAQEQLSTVMSASDQQLSKFLDTELGADMSTKDKADRNIRNYREGKLNDVATLSYRLSRQRKTLQGIYGDPDLDQQGIDILTNVFDAFDMFGDINNSQAKGAMNRVIALKGRHPINRPLITKEETIKQQKIKKDRQEEQKAKAQKKQEQKQRRQDQFIDSVTSHFVQEHDRQAHLRNRQSQITNRLSGLTKPKEKSVEEVSQDIQKSLAFDVKSYDKIVQNAKQVANAYANFRQLQGNLPAMKMLQALGVDSTDQNISAIRYNGNAELAQQLVKMKTSGIDQISLKEALQSGQLDEISARNVQTAINALSEAQQKGTVIAQMYAEAQASVNNQLARKEYTEVPLAKKEQKIAEILNKQINTKDYTRQQLYDLEKETKALLSDPKYLKAGEFQKALWAKIQNPDFREMNPDQLFQKWQSQKINNPFSGKGSKYEKQGGDAAYIQSLRMAKDQTGKRRFTDEQIFSAKEGIYSSAEAYDEYMMQTYGDYNAIMKEEQLLQEKLKQIQEARVKRQKEEAKNPTLKKQKPTQQKKQSAGTKEETKADLTAISGEFTSIVDVIRTELPNAIRSAIEQIRSSFNELSSILSRVVSNVSQAQKSDIQKKILRNGQEIAGSIITSDSKPNKIIAPGDIIIDTKGRSQDDIRNQEEMNLGSRDVRDMILGVDRYPRKTTQEIGQEILSVRSAGLDKKVISAQDYINQLVLRTKELKENFEDYNEAPYLYEDNQVYEIANNYRDSLISALKSSEQNFKEISDFYFSPEFKSKANISDNDFRERLSLDYIYHSAVDEVKNQLQNDLLESINRLSHYDGLDISSPQIQSIKTAYQQKSIDLIKRLSGNPEYGFSYDKFSLLLNNDKQIKTGNLLWNLANNKVANKDSESLPSKVITEGSINSDLSSVITSIKNGILDVGNVAQSTLSSLETRISALGLNNNSANMYKTLKNWGQSDTIIEKFRNGMSMERGAFINSKTGLMTNPFLYDQRNSFNHNQIFQWMKNNGYRMHDFDTDVHSHPMREFINPFGDGIDYKTIGYDLLPSQEDFDSWSRVSAQGITKMLIQSGGKILDFDFSAIKSFLQKNVTSDPNSELSNIIQRIGSYAKQKQNAYWADYAHEQMGIKDLNSYTLKDVALHYIKSKGGLDEKNKTLDFSLFSNKNADILRAATYEALSDFNLSSLTDQTFTGIRNLSDLSSAQPSLNDYLSSVDKLVSRLNEVLNILEQIRAASKIDLQLTKNGNPLKEQKPSGVQASDLSGRLGSIFGGNEPDKETEQHKPSVSKTNKVKLIKDKGTGDYYTEDHKYRVKKSSSGWDVSERDTASTQEDAYKFSFTNKTLNEVQESLSNVQEAAQKAKHSLDEQAQSQEKVINKTKGQAKTQGKSAKKSEHSASGQVKKSKQKPTYEQLEGETDEDLLLRVAKDKSKIGTWQDIADIINELTGKNYSESKYRKQYTNYQKKSQTAESYSERTASAKQEEVSDRIEQQLFGQKKSKSPVKSQTKTDFDQDQLLTSMQGIFDSFEGATTGATELSSSVDHLSESMKQAAESTDSHTEKQQVENHEQPEPKQEQVIVEDGYRNKPRSAEQYTEAKRKQLEENTWAIQNAISNEKLYADRIDEDSINRLKRSLLKNYIQYMNEQMSDDLSAFAIGSEKDKYRDQNGWFMDQIEAIQQAARNQYKASINKSTPSISEQDLDFLRYNAKRAYDYKAKHADERSSLSIKADEGIATEKELAELKDLESSFAACQKAIDAYSAAMEGAEEKTESIINAQNKLIQANEEVEKMKPQRVHEAAEARKRLQSDDAIADVNQQIKEIQNRNVIGLEDRLKTTSSKIDEYSLKYARNQIDRATYIKKSKSELGKIKNVVRVMNTDDVANARAEIEKMMVADAKANNYLLDPSKIKYGGATQKGKHRYTADIRRDDGRDQTLVYSFDEQSRSIEKLNGKLVQNEGLLSKFGSAWKGKIMEMGAYLASFASIYEVFDWIKQGVATVTEFDTALTEMRKVSDESVSSLTNFQAESFSLADSVGTTGLQIQKSTADFMRLGQSLTEAKESAKNASLLFNVSEFDSIDDATTSLIAMSQAFDDYSQTEILDSLNKVGNEYSISTEGLSTALQESASALRTEGNDLAQSIALITSANQVVQDPNKVGAGIRTISLRLAGQKQILEAEGEDTTGMADTTSKLRENILNATRVKSNNFLGVDIEDANGNLRSTYDILLDIAQIWKQIGQTDIQNGTNEQAFLLETMAGKNRSNILASLLESPDILRGAYEAANNAAGSAQKENAKFMESIQGKQQQFMNSVQEFTSSLMSSDLIKWFIDFGTTALGVINDIINGIGSLQSIIGGGFLTTGIVSFVKNFDKFKLEGQKVTNAKNIFNFARSSFKKGNTASQTLGQMFNTGIIDSNNKEQLAVAQKQLGKVYGKSVASNAITQYMNEAVGQVAGNIVQKGAETASKVAEESAEKATTKVGKESAEKATTKVVQEAIENTNNISEAAESVSQVSEAATDVKQAMDNVGDGADTIQDVADKAVQLADDLGNVADQADEFADNIRGASKAGSLFDGIKAKIVNIGTALKGVGTAIKGAFVSHPFIAAAAGVAALVAGIAIYNKKKKEALKTEAIEGTSQWNQAKESLQGYIDQYTQLKLQLDSGDLSEEQQIGVKQQILDLQRQIVEQYGAQASGIDLVNGKLSEQLTQLNSISQNEAITNIAENAQGYQDAMDEMQKKRNYRIFENFDEIKDTNLGKQIDSILQNYQGFSEQFENITSGFGPAIQSSFIEFNGNASEAHQALTSLIADLNGIKNVSPEQAPILQHLIAQANSAVEGLSGTLNDYQANYDSYLEQTLYANGGGDKVIDLSSAIDNYNTALLGSNEQAIDDARQRFEETALSMRTFIGELFSDGVISPQMAKGLNDYFATMLQGLNKGQIQLHDFSEALSDSMSGKQFDKGNMYASRFDESIKNIAKDIKDMDLDQVDIQQMWDLDGTNEQQQAVRRLAEAFDITSDMWGSGTDQAESKLRQFINALVQAGVITGQVAAQAAEAEQQLSNVWQDKNLSDVQDASKQTELGDNYDSYVKNLKRAKELRDSSDVGTKQFKALAKSFSPSGSTGWQNFDQNVPGAEKWFSGDETQDIDNFLADMQQAGYAIQDETGNWSMNISDLGQVAMKTVHPVQQVVAMLGLLSDKGFNVTAYASAEQAMAGLKDKTLELHDAEQKLEHMKELQAEGYGDYSLAISEQEEQVDRLRNQVETSTDMIPELAKKQAQGAKEQAKLATGYINQMYQQYKAIEDDTTIDEDTKYSILHNMEEQIKAYAEENGLTLDITGATLTVDENSGIIQKTKDAIDAYQKGNQKQVDMLSEELAGKEIEALGSGKQSILSKLGFNLQGVDTANSQAVAQAVREQLGDVATFFKENGITSDAQNLSAEITSNASQNAQGIISAIYQAAEFKTKTPEQKKKEEQDKFREGVLTKAKEAADAKRAQTAEQRKKQQQEEFREGVLTKAKNAADKKRQQIKKNKQEETIDKVRNDRLKQAESTMSYDPMHKEDYADRKKYEQRRKQRQNQHSEPEPEVEAQVQVVEPVVVPQNKEYSSEGLPNETVLENPTIESNNTTIQTNSPQQSKPIQGSNSFQDPFIKSKIQKELQKKQQQLQENRRTQTNKQSNIPDEVKDYVHEQGVDDIHSLAKAIEQYNKPYREGQAQHQTEQINTSNTTNEPSKESDFYGPPTFEQYLNTLSQEEIDHLNNKIPQETLPSQTEIKADNVVVQANEDIQTSDTETAEVVQQKTDIAGQLLHFFDTDVALNGALNQKQQEQPVQRQVEANIQTEQQEITARMVVTDVETPETDTSVPVTGQMETVQNEVSETPEVQVQGVMSQVKQEVTSIPEDRSAAPKPVQQSSPTPQPSVPKTETSTESKVTVDTSEVDQAQTKVDELSNTQIAGKNFNVNANNVDKTKSDIASLDAQQIQSKQFNVSSPTLGGCVSQVVNLRDQLNQLNGRSATFTVNIRTNGSVPNVPSGGGTGPAIGTAHALGTVKTPLKTISNAYAQGRDFTVGHNETAVVNELAPNRPESIIRDGKFSVIPGGPQMMKLRPDDIILNPDQTEDMLRSGKTARAGKLFAAHKTGSTDTTTTLPAFANGTANDLVGERGMEMYVNPKEGKWHTIGENGPEMVDLPNDAIVFNAKQTADLMSRGHTNTRGHVAYADGSMDVDNSDILMSLISDPMSGLDGDAYVSGNANLQNSNGATGSFYGKLPPKRGSGYTAPAPTTTTNPAVNAATKANTKATDENTKAKKKNSEETEKNTDKKKKEAQKIDWITSRLGLLGDETNKYANAINDYMSYSDKMVNLIGNIDENGNVVPGVDSVGRTRKGQLGSLLQEMTETSKAISVYKQAARDVKDPYSSKQIQKDVKNSKKKKRTKKEQQKYDKLSEKEKKKQDKKEKEERQQAKKDAKSKRKANKDFSKYKDLIDQGYDIKISTIKDENLYNAIQDYQGYVDSSRQASNTTQELHNKLVDLFATWAQAPLDEAEKQIQKIETALKAVEATLDGIRKGGSTLAALGGGGGAAGNASGSYKLLGGAGYRAFRAANRTKTSLMYQKQAVWMAAVGQIQQQMSKFQQFADNLIQQKLKEQQEAQARLDAARAAQANIITKTQVKDRGKAIRKQYKGQLTKKQINALKKGYKLKTKGLSGSLKKAVKSYNNYVDAYRAQNPAIQYAAKAILDNQKYQKLLTKEQIKSLKRGEKVSTKGVKDKTLKNKLKKYNKKLKAYNKSGSNIPQLEDEAEQTYIDLSDIRADLAAGVQAFVDAADQAMAEAQLAGIEAAIQRVQEIRDAFDYINESFETQIAYQETLIALNEQLIADAETFGNSIPAEMRDRQKYNVGIQRHLKEEEVHTLEMQLAEGVNSGIIIEESKEWVEMQTIINECKQAVHDYDVEIKKLEMKKFDDINDHYNTQLQLLSTMREYYGLLITDTEKFGDQVYPQMRDFQKQSIELEKQRKQIQADALQRQFDSVVSQGYVDEYSLEWINLKNDIYEAKMAVHDYEIQQKELDIKKLQDIADHYGKIINFMETMAELNNIWYERDEAINNYKKMSYYADNIADKQAIANKQMEKASKEQQMFNDLTDQGVYAVNSDSYIAKQAEINKLWKEAYDTQNEIAKLEAERIQYQIENFNRVLEKQSAFIDNLNVMAGLITEAATWDYDTGNLLEAGQLTMVVDKQTFDQALADIQTIEKEKDRLFEEFRNNANYGQQAFDENIKDLTEAQIEALQSAKSALEQFTQTVEMTAQRQLAALNKVIDKHKDALAKKKEYFDYDRQLRDQNREIAILQAQSRALTDVTDAESKAMKARIDAQLAQKKEEQEDTIRDHTVQLMTDGLTRLQDKLQENYEEWEHEFEASSAQQLAVMRSTNLSTGQLATTMDSLLSTFGTNMKQLGTQVGNVNAATANAVYAVNGRFNGFIQNDTAYGIASRANADMQQKLVTALSGPISDVMSNKLAAIWNTVVSAGDQQMKETLDYTGFYIADHLMRLEEIGTNLPWELVDPLSTIGDSIVDAVRNETSNEQIAFDGIMGSLLAIHTAIQGNSMSVWKTMDSTLEAIQNIVNDIKGFITPSSKSANEDPAPIQSGGGHIDSEAAVRDIVKSVDTTITQEMLSNAAHSNDYGKTDNKDDNKNKSSNSNSEFVAIHDDNTKKDNDKDKKKDKDDDKKKNSSSGITKSKKAIGARKINKKDRYLTQEKGGEIITTKDGVLIPLEPGDGVIPAQLTQKLFEMARDYPNLPNMPMVDVPQIPVSGSKTNVNISYGSLLTINGNVTEETLPGLKEILKQSYEYTVRKISADMRRGGMRKSY